MKKLSIIIPVYNEINTVSIVLHKLKKLQLTDNYETQLIIVDDSSNDGSKELLKDLEKKEIFKKDTFVFKERNLGKGDSQKIAIPLCSGNFTIIQDADLEYNVENINSLLKLAIELCLSIDIFFSKQEKRKIVDNKMRNLNISAKSDNLVIDMLFNLFFKLIKQFRIIFKDKFDCVPSLT